MRIAPFQFVKIRECLELPIGSMYGIYTNIGGILMVNVTIYSSTMDPMGGGSSMYGTPHILPIFFRALPAQDWPGPKLWCEGPETISLRDNFNKDERTGEGPLSS